jgi:acetolactate synthase-1/2/3 large subunit
VIATDIPAALRRPGVYRGVLHETTDQAAMFAPVVKETLTVASAEDVAPLTARAIASATAAPARPVYLGVPTDLLSADAPAGATAPAPATAVGPSARAVELIDAAERPLIWAGSGALGGDGVRRLAERIGAPVVTTYGASGLLAPAHPCSVGMPPHVEAVGRLWDAADLVISVGSDLDGVQTQNFAQPQPPRMLAINLDEADATKNYAADVVLEAEASEACAAIAEAVRERSMDGLADRMHGVRADACGTLDARALRFLDAIRFAVPDDGIVVADMCIPGYWLAGFHTPSHPRKLQIPLGWGTLGYAFPAALAEHVTDPTPSVLVAKAEALTPPPTTSPNWYRKR